MAKCPKCGNEIDHLINWVRQDVGYYFSVDSEGNEENRFMDESCYIDDGEYECPKCQAVLFEDTELALEFLKQK